MKVIGTMGNVRDREKNFGHQVTHMKVTGNIQGRYL
jgi:hypothetical protein